MLAYGFARGVYDARPDDGLTLVDAAKRAWDDALGKKDLEAALSLYDHDASIESPLVQHLLEQRDGIVRGKDNLRSGGEVLVDQLLVNGVRHVFCVPGESYLAALDAFYDRDIAVTVCRQEGGAVMMAEAHGKLTGRPGIAFVTRGPGATNGSPGLHIAKQDSSPMIMFVGQVAREMREREAFQELDYRAVFGTMVKWATEIDDPARIPEIVSRAFHVAMNGRPGPVVIALPEDMLMERVSVDDALAADLIETWPGLTDMSHLQKMLWAYTIYSAALTPVVLAAFYSKRVTAYSHRFSRRVTWSMWGL